MFQRISVSCVPCGPKAPVSVSCAIPCFQSSRPVRHLHTCPNICGTQRPSPALQSGRRRLRAPCCTEQRCDRSDPDLPRHKWSSVPETASEPYEWPTPRMVSLIRRNPDRSDPVRAHRYRAAAPEHHRHSRCPHRLREPDLQVALRHGSDLEAEEQRLNKSLTCPRYARYFMRIQPGAVWKG